VNYPEPSARSGVLHVLWSLDIGGAERAVYQLVREQIRTGMRADVLVASHAGFYGELARQEGAVVHELRQRRALDIPRALTAASIIKRYEIAHFQGREPVLMEIARRQRKARLLYTHRGGVKHYSRSKRLRHRLVGRSLGDFDVLSANTVQSARAASKIFRMPQEEFHVVYNGVDFSLLAPTSAAEDVRAEAGLPSDVFVMGTCAKLLGLKRIDRLIRATAALPPNVHCLVVGDGPQRRALELLAEDLGIRRRVAFVGLRESVGDYLQLMDVFALPSGPDEGFGNSLVEAMAVGIASVVFADGGGLLEHISDGRTGLVARDQRDFEGRLGELVEDSSLRRRMGQAASAFVRSRYTVEDAAAGYARLYSLSLGRSSAAA
jgi:glycosyltransferase involved in cell wall biosynthesis